MARQPGYICNVRLFIPAPKGDFKAQANAATLMASLQETKALTPELIAVAKVTQVTGAFSSMEVEDAPAPEAPTPPAEPETPQEGGRRGRQSAAG